MELTRKQVIEILEKADSTVYKEPKTKTAQALEYAISSLKTDEAYQLMYEGGEIFTKDEVVDILTELQLEIEELDSRAGYDGNGMPTFSTDYIRKKKVSEIIQQKINALKGEQRIDELNGD